MNHEPHPRPVVAGVDGSDVAQRAVVAAADEARRRAAPLRLLHAVAETPGRTASGEDDLAAVLHADAATILQAAADSVEGVVDAGVTTEIVDGDPVEVLERASHDAQLVVVGSRGVGGLLGLLIGSTANGVVGRAACPVLVVQEEDEGVVHGRRSVVVGVAGRPEDEEVLAFACAEAVSRGTDLIAVHSWEDVVLDSPVRSVGPLVDWSGVRCEEERLLAEALAGWREKEPDLVVREVVVRDRPARALVSAAMTAELLVVGHRPRRTLGSTTYGVLHRAGCPVAVVPFGPGATA